jgi:hypothetical protein
MFWTHSSFFFVAWHLLHREAVSVVQYCNFYIAQESHKINAVVSEVQKNVGCVTIWKRGDLGCHSSIAHSWQFCVSSVHFWFGKGDVNYGEDLHSSCTVQLGNFVPKM